MMDDLLTEFVAEGRDLVAEAQRALSTLAARPDDATALDVCFRALHTLKGSTGLFDLVPMGLLLHAAEDRLTLIRDGAGGVDLLVDAMDQVERWLDAVERDGRLPPDSGFVADTEGLRLREGGQAEPKAAAPGWTVPAEFAGQTGTAIRYVPRADCYYLGDDPVAIVAAIPGLTSLRLSAREPWAPPDSYDPFTCNLVIEAVSSAGREQVAAAFRLVADQVELVELAGAAAEPAADAGVARRTLRVDAARIDRLADLVDDLVIAKGGLATLAAQADALPGGHALAQGLRARQARLDRLVGDLHATVGQVRLVPLAPLFGRFPRLVRDTARIVGKAVTLETEGGEVEVDKAVVDALFDPLLHVLRNAIDHGIEGADARRRAGKPEAGAVRLLARVAADQVVIEVADDGAGIDPRRIRDRAVDRAMLTREQADRLEDPAAIDLIFAPGFSTASAVSTVSGRGIGMDVVRASVAALSGKVSIASSSGRGTVVQFRLPLAMTLTRILIVRCGAERFGLPLDAVVETARLPPGSVTTVRASQAFQHREQVIPLVSLGRLLGAAEADAPADRVVIATVRGELVGFAVDAFVDRTDAAVRPMGGLLAHAAGLAGTTVLADGTLLLVLDLAELIA